MDFRVEDDNPWHQTKRSYSDSLLQHSEGPVTRVGLSTTPWNRTYSGSSKVGWGVGMRSRFFCLFVWFFFFKSETRSVLITHKDFMRGRNPSYKYTNLI